MATIVSPITIAQAAPVTGTVLRYDGIKQFAAVPTEIAASFPSLSVEAWVNLDGIPGTAWTLPGTLWANEDASFVLTFNAIPPAASLSIGSASFGHPFYPGLWYYIVISFDNVTAKATLYVDGRQSLVLPNPIDWNPGGPVTLGPAWIGASKTAPSNFFQGAIGTVRIWKGVLTQENIQKLMFQSLSGTVRVTNASQQEVTLIANWRCNEGYGGIAFDYSSGGDWDLVLGGGNLPEQKPGWQISTILKPPDFISLPPIPPDLLANFVEGESSIRALPRHALVLSGEDAKTDEAKLETDSSTGAGTEEESGQPKKKPIPKHKPKEKEKE